MPSQDRRFSVACLLFCSGFCALIYQTVWLREFRLIFGASTAASAAVLGIFMGGLGLGSAWLGRRAETAKRPLLYYGNLEVLIALSAALTPGLVWLVRHLYAATGGTMVLGHGLGTVVRLLLASLVLIVPTFLMGGTLPAAGRAASSEDDIGRRSLALLYGFNTLGAVTGAALSTFWLVEHFGNRNALWIACGLNMIIALIARVVGRAMPEIESQEAPVEELSAVANYRFVVVAAGLVGFAFMLMELVWYRILGPILGGSTFTFGLILVVALLGIGIGGGFYAMRRASRPAALGGFALTCALEAGALALPFFLGDRLANLALLLRSLGSMGLAGQVFGWFIVTSCVVLPAAMVAGYQFPMLIALLGQGRAGVAHHTGQAYAANTLGAIIGSLAGGFGLLPALGALGVWRAVTLLLALLAGVAAMLEIRRQSRLALVSLSAATIAVVAIFSATGPTAAWRHSGIGAGRADPTIGNPDTWYQLTNGMGRALIWETDGIESSVALSAQEAYAFVVNGKIDGNARYDSGTQVMSGLLGCLLHGDVRRSMVIGLGTGSTAGWLGQVPAMERVDVVELEPAIVKIAEACTPVNRDVLKNPKVAIHMGDAREVLLATPERYDLIFSEPSNPYRAGIASLFTQDFYRAAIQRLKPGGVFLQWVQAYEVDGEAVQTIYASLGSVFPQIQTWRTQANDLVLVATREPLTLDAAKLREQIAGEPYRTALQDVWRVDSIEGLFAHFLANEDMARMVVNAGHPIATDDRNSLEYGFARAIGRSARVNLSYELVVFTRSRQLTRPLRLMGEIDWERVGLNELAFNTMYHSDNLPVEKEPELHRYWREFFALYASSEYNQAAAFLSKKLMPPPNRFALEACAEVLAVAADPRAPAYIDQVAKVRPTDGQALRAVLLARQQKFAEAADAFAAAFVAWRTDPWVRLETAHVAIWGAQTLAERCGDEAVALRLFNALREPLAVELAREARLAALIEIAPRTAPQLANPQMREALANYGRNPLWTKPFLMRRAQILHQLQDPLFEDAAADLRNLLDREPTRFETGLPAKPVGAQAKL